MTPQQTAERVRQRLYERDHAAHHLGIEVTAIGPGSADVTMTVREHMLNGHATCHGGLIATLADTAFAYACNAGDQMTVASSFAIELLAPARLGERLTATATEVSRKGRTGIYDVDVRNAQGDHIAAFRGRSYAIKGQPAVGE